MNFNNHKAQKEIYNRVLSQYSTIQVKPGKGLWNFRCQYNSSHFALKGKHKKLAMCMCVESNGSVFIHFVNYHKGKFMDNTLGEWSKQYEYYFVRWIDKSDFLNVDFIFGAFRKELRNNLSWWVKLTSDFAA